MKISSSMRYSLLALTAFAVTLSATPFAAAATRIGLQNPGGVRSTSAGTTASVEADTAVAMVKVNISVTYQGNPVSKASVSITSPQGAVIASGVTTKSGQFSANVKAGNYAVAASSKGHVATNTVTVEGSAKSLALTLQ